MMEIAAIFNAVASLVWVVLAFLAFVVLAGIPIFVRLSSMKQPAANESVPPSTDDAELTTLRYLVGRAWSHVPDNEWRREAAPVMEAIGLNRSPYLPPNVSNMPVDAPTIQRNGFVQAMDKLPEPE